VNYRSVKAMRPLLEHLEPLGVLPPPVPVVPGAADALLVRYRGYLVVERGLAEATAEGYLWSVRPFVAGRARGGGLDLAGLTAGDVTAFVLAACPHRATGSAKLIVTALRSLLSFLHVTGEVPASLACAVPSVAGWRLTGLPRDLAPGQLRRLLASCARRRATGRRDYAILLLLARLGLRAGEVAALGLDDIDWHAGQIAVRGKGNRTERLPPPAARRRGRRDRELPAPRAARHRRWAQRVRAGQGAAPGADDWRGIDGRVRPRPARWPGRDPRAPAAAHHRDAAVTRDRPLARPRQRRNNPDLPHADLRLKEQALARTRPPASPPGRYRPPDNIIAWLDAL
jgi:Phage integrase family